MGPAAPDFAAASDGDGDRNMILGRGTCVTPSDSLAVLAANAQLAPGYAGACAASRARCRRAARRPGRREARHPRLRDAHGLEGSSAPCWTRASRRSAAKRAQARARTTCGRRTVCGRCCSGSTSSPGAANPYASSSTLTGPSTAATTAPATTSRAWTRRRGNVDVGSAEPAREAARRRCGDLRILAADDFSYRDPVDGSTADAQGVRIFFEGNARAVFRLSGTGTVGATLRVYLERFEAGSGAIGLDPQRPWPRSSTRPRTSPESMPGWAAPGRTCGLEPSRASRVPGRRGAAPVHRVPPALRHREVAVRRDAQRLAAGGLAGGPRPS